ATVNCRLFSARFNPSVFAKAKPPPFGKGRSLTFTQINNASQHISLPWEGGRGRTLNILLPTATVNCRLFSARFNPSVFAKAKPPPFGKGRSLTFTQIN